jgi:hypothetical protein
MRKTLFAILVIGALTHVSATIGPVGTYLGYRLRLQAATSSSTWDSVHIDPPINLDSVSRASSNDTTVIATELSYHGPYGYAMHTVSWSNDRMSMTYDTTYESLGVYLKSPQSTGNSTVFATLYQIPFVVGDSWRTGTEGTYFLGPDSTGLVDTIHIWADTSRVVARETVVTPFDTVPDCYKIRTFSRVFATTAMSGFPIHDSQTVVNIQWYKDSLWLVKDTSYSSGKIYALVAHFWLSVGENFISARSELDSQPVTGIEFTPWVRKQSESGWRVLPNPFSGSCVIQAPALSIGKPFRVIDVTGRVVYAARAFGQQAWLPKGLAPGVYRIVGPGGGLTVVHTQ